MLNVVFRANTFNTENASERTLESGLITNVCYQETKIQTFLLSLVSIGWVIGLA